MRAGLGGLLAGLTALMLVSCGSGAAGPSVTPSPEQAITGFDPSNAAAIQAGFLALNQSAHDNPTGLRQAALKHLGDSNTWVHYAAVYGLALTVTPTQGSAEVATMLSATNLDDRLLAAGALAGIGDKRGLPVLIAALDQGDKLSFRDPPQPAFDFARAELLYFTTEDFGLRGSTDLASVAATKPAWLGWWQANQSSIHFDTSSRKYAT
jgi:hypothetical protein